MKKKIIVFLSSLGIFALLAWLGGYNFDTRNFWVAYYSLFAIGASALMVWSLSL